MRLQHTIRTVTLSAVAPSDTADANADGSTLKAGASTIKAASTSGVYDPSPHIVYLGSPETRSGPDSQSVPGIILRQVWVSRNPRPAFANK